MLLLLSDVLCHCTFEFRHSLRKLLGLMTQDLPRGPCCSPACMLKWIWTVLFAGLMPANTPLIVHEAAQ